MPLLTTPWARVAASLLHAVGLPELVAPTIDAYVAQAIALAIPENAIVVDESITTGRGLARLASRRLSIVSRSGLSVATTTTSGAKAAASASS